MYKIYRLYCKILTDIVLYYNQLYRQSHYNALYTEANSLDKMISILFLLLRFEMGKACSRGGQQSQSNLIYLLSFN